MEKSNERKLTSKITDFLEKSQISNFKERTQLEKTGSIGKVFIRLEILTLNSTFETSKRSRFFCVISTFVFVECYLRQFQQTNFTGTQKVHIYLGAFINASICMQKKKTRKQQDLYKSLQYIHKSEKIDEHFLNALYISRTIYDWHFFDKLNQFAK